MELNEQMLEKIISAVMEELKLRGFCLDKYSNAENEDKKQGENDDALKNLQRTTTARLCVGRAGPRLKTKTLLNLRSDHARAADAVMLDVEDQVINDLDLFRVQTCCQDKNEYLTRPDLGRRLRDDQIEIIRKRCRMAPDVQLCVADGLSSTAINANIGNLLPMLMESLKSKNINVGTPFFIKYGRVGVEDHIAEIVGAKVICIFVGERPGLGTAESMSAYIVYNARPGIEESCRTVVSNIHKDGIPAVEAGAYMADLIEKILRLKTSGVELVQKEKEYEG